MVVTINGTRVELEQPVSIQEYLDSSGIPYRTVVVEYNGILPPRQQWREILLQDHDTVEIVKFIGGG